MESPEENKVVELRRLYTEKLASEGLSADYFHKNDIHKMNSSDEWLKRFLIHHDDKVEESFNMLWETLTWRKENRVNDISESTVNLDFLKDGSMYIHSQDIDGKLLLIFKCKMHVKGQKDWEENKRCIIYWFERAERMNKGNQITIFFDMAGSGLTNMDMDYTKYLIGLCKQYYPNFLNYILIFEMPWVMNAAFKIIKSWLPAKAVEKIKFLSKATLKDYVEPKHALKCWGGEDEYEFTFIPEVLPLDRNSNELPVEETRKRVHFLDGSPGDLSNDTFSTVHSVEDDQSPFTTSTKLRIFPQDCVVFKREKNGDVSGYISLTNLNKKNITFKIKTTSPDKFRVRPGTGILSTDEKIQVCITIVEGVFTRDIVSDKFLVMSTILDQSCESSDKSSSTDLVVLWKSMDMKTVDQHRLKCSVHTSVNSDSIIPLITLSNGNVKSMGGSSSGSSGSMNYESRKTDSLCHAIQNLTEDNKKVKKQLREIQYLLLFSLSIVVLLFAIIMYSTMNNNKNDRTSLAQLDKSICDICTSIVTPNTISSDGSLPPPDSASASHNSA